MKRFSDVRKIKIFGDIVEKEKTGFMPNTLLLNRNTENTSFYPTQFFLNDSKLSEIEFANNRQLVKSKRTVSELMEIPDLSIPLTDILNIYNTNHFLD